MTLSCRFVPETIAYDGAALRAHWALRRFGIEGDVLVAFRGPCNVRDDEMADLADLGGPGIAGDDMLHFVWERFDDATLEAGILRQRLLSAIAFEELSSRDVAVRRDGDDLFAGDRKLSISIATRSPVSSLVHFALNVRNAGTPVATSALGDWGIEPAEFARAIFARVEREEAGIAAARSKVRAKGES